MLFLELSHHLCLSIPILTMGPRLQLLLPLLKTSPIRLPHRVLQALANALSFMIYRHLTWRLQLSGTQSFPFCFSSCRVLHAYYPKVISFGYPSVYFLLLYSPLPPPHAIIDYCFPGCTLIHQDSRFCVQSSINSEVMIFLHWLTSNLYPRLDDIKSVVSVSFFSFVLLLTSCHAIIQAWHCNYPCVLHVLRVCKPIPLEMTFLYSFSDIFLPPIQDIYLKMLSWPL